jgi:hypothetical protein
MHGEAAGTGGGINYIFFSGWIEHLHAHINHMARREVLALFALTGLDGQVLESLVNDGKIGVEQLHPLQEGTANLQVVRLQANALPRLEYSRPFIAGFGKQAVNEFGKLPWGMAAHTEGQIPLALR